MRIPPFSSAMCRAGSRLVCKLYNPLSCSREKHTQSDIPGLLYRTHSPGKHDNRRLQALTPTGHRWGIAVIPKSTAGYTLGRWKITS